MQINDPAVITEVTRCYEAYEKALIDDDVAALEGLFWDSPHAMRVGIAEDLARDVVRRDITAFGDAAGIVNLEFLSPMNGIERYGRQTQVWFKFPEGWRIASAHVSLMPLKPLPEQAGYVQAAAREIGLPIDTGHFAAVGDDLTRIAAIAEFLTQFPLSQSVEAAPVFEP